MIAIKTTTFNVFSNDCLFFSAPSSVYLANEFPSKFIDTAQVSLPLFHLLVICCCHCYLCSWKSVNCCSRHCCGCRCCCCCRRKPLPPPPHSWCCWFPQRSCCRCCAAVTFADSTVSVAVVDLRSHRLAPSVIERREQQASPESLLTRQKYWR